MSFGLKNLRRHQNQIFSVYLLTSMLVNGMHSRTLQPVRTLSISPRVFLLIIGVPRQCCHSLFIRKAKLTRPCLQVAERICLLQYKDRVTWVHCSISPNQNKAIQSLTSCFLREINIDKQVTYNYGDTLLC